MSMGVASVNGRRVEVSTKRSDLRPTETALGRQRQRHGERPFHQQLQ